MSSINTNGIDVNYPVPGQNNSTQGFRDNFANIKQNLNTASTEISDLQNKVLLKQALANSTLNNDMAGALISNATTLNFRGSTYNLGNAMSGTVLVDISLGDVQYGNIAGNTTFQFGNWAPINTESVVILNLGISNANAVITFPGEVTTNPTGYGVSILENYKSINGVSTITAPSNCDVLSYRLSTLDCGNTIQITPLNRSYQTTQINSSVPPSTGQLGDKSGAVSVGPQVEQVLVQGTSNTSVIINSAKVQLNSCEISGTTLTVYDIDFADMRNCYITDNELFVGYLEYGNIQIGMELTGANVVPGTTITGFINSIGGSSTWIVDIPQTVAAGTNIIGEAFIQNGMLLSGTGILANTYIISNDSDIGTTSVWTISQSHTPTGGISAIAQTGIVGDLLYVGAVEAGLVQIGARLTGTDILDNTIIIGYNDTNVYFVSNNQYIAPNTIVGLRDAVTCNSTSLFYPDMPIVFTGDLFGNLMPGVIYYVKDVMTTTDFSVTLTPGGDGTTFVLSNDVGTMFGNPINYMYICSQDYNGVQIGPKNVLNTYSTTNYIKLDNVVGLQENSPIRFAGQVIGNLYADNWYYIKEIDSGNANISVSLTKINGVAGTVLELPTSNALGANTCQAYSIVGSDIWRQIPLIPNYNQSNISAASLTVADTLNVQGNAIVLGNLEVSGTVTYEQADYNNIYAQEGEFEDINANNITSNTLTVTGLVTFDSNANFKLQGGTSGQYLQTNGDGNLVWADGTATPGSDSAGGSNTQVQFNEDNILTGKAGFEFDTASDVLSIPGDLVANNANNTIVTNNAIISNVLTANTGVVLLPDVANLTIEGGTAGYYLQSNGAGGLVWAGGTGNVTGNGTANGIQYAIQYSAGDGNFLANSDFTFSNANANLSVPGNINLTGNIVADGGVFASGTVSGTLLIGTLNAGSSSQPNITTVGTLTSLAVDGSVNANALFANTGTTIDPDNVSGFAAGKIVQSGFYAAPGKPGIVIGNSAGQHGAIVYDSTAPGLVFGTESGSANTMAARARLFSNNTFKVDYLDGTLLTGNQSYITKVGTLTSLGVIGNVNASNFVGSLANGVSSVKIPVASGNVNISAYGNANVLTVTGTGINVKGNVELSGNVSSNGNGAGIISSFLNTSGNSYGNLDVNAEVGNGVGIRALAATFTDTVASATSSITLAAAHALAAPVLDASNVNITLTKAATFAIMGEPDNGSNTTLNPVNSYALYANGKVYVDGNITSTGLLNAANINLTSNLTTQNLSVLDTAVFSSVSSVEIPGGSMGYFLQTDGLGNLTWAPGTVTASGTGTSYGVNDLVQVSNGVGGFNAYSGFYYNGSNLSVPGNVVASNGLYGTLRTAAQPNITSVGALTSLTVVGNMSVVSIGSGVTSRYISIANSMTGNANTNDMSLAGGLGFRTFPTTYTTSNPTGTVNEAAIHVISQPTVAGSNTGTILANASTLLINGAPTGTGANMTITNAYALTVQGNAKFTGVSTFTGNVSACANVTFANVESIKIGNTTSYAGYYLQTDGANNLQWAQGTIDAISSPGGTNTQVQFNDNTVLAGSANFVFDKTSGNLTLTGNGNITGNLTVGNVIYNNSKGTAGQVLTIYGNGLTYWSTAGAGSGISNGSSNISVVSSGGNINVYPTSSYTNLLGNTISLGNFRVGASWGTAVQYANTRPTLANQFLMSNADGLSFWGEPIQIINGTSQVIIPTLNGDIEFDSGANANVMSIAPGGVTVNIGKLTVGSVKYTNAWTIADAGKVLTVDATGNTSWVAGGGGSGSVISNGTSSVSIPAVNGNINISSGGNANVLIVTDKGAGITGNLLVSNILSASSIVAVNSLQVGTSSSNVKYTDSRGTGDGYVLAINTTTGETYWKNVTTGASSIAYSTAIVDITTGGNVRLRPSVLTTGGGKVVIETNTGGATDVIVNGDIKPSGSVIAGGKLQAGTIIYTNVAPPDTIERYLKLNADLTTSWTTIPTGGGGGGGSYINNGASNVYIGSSDGPITANVSGAQIAIIKSTGIETTRTVKIGDVVYTNVAGTGNEGKFLKLGPGGSTFWDFASGSGSTTTPTKIEQGGGKVEALSDGSLLLRPTDAAAGNILMSRNTGLLSANIVGNLNLQGVGGGYIKAKGFVFDAEAIVTATGSISLTTIHNGRVIYIDSASASTVTVTPAALPTGFSCVVIQGGTGQVTVSGASAVGGKNKSSGQYAVMTVLQVTASVAILSGDITT